VACSAFLRCNKITFVFQNASIKKTPNSVIIGRIILIS
jgi:hypothetical protein